MLPQFSHHNFPFCFFECTFCICFFYSVLFFFLSYLGIYQYWICIFLFRFLILGKFIFFLLTSDLIVTLYEKSFITYMLHFLKLCIWNTCKWVFPSYRIIWILFLHFYYIDVIKTTEYMIHYNHVNINYEWKMII